MRLPTLLFGCLVLVSLAANLIANERPLAVSFRGRLYFPVMEDLSGQTFGPQFLPTLADYQNPETRAAIRAQGWLVFPPIPYSARTIVLAAAPAPAPPSARDWLGTDSASRDVLARLIYGIRVSLLFGFALTAAAAGLGILAGSVQGYYGGVTDLLLQRFTEIWSGLPQIFLIIILASLLRPSVFSLLLLLTLFSWTGLANRVRAEFLRIRRLDYILAARGLGTPDWQIMWRHVLPNASVAIFTFLPFMLAESITLLAGLDYLGFGLPAGTPSLGELLTEAINNPQAPWLGIAVFATLAGLLTLLVLIGTGLRQALDPHGRRS